MTLLLQRYKKRLLKPRLFRHAAQLSPSPNKSYYSSREVLALLDEKVADELVAEVMARVKPC